MIEKLGTVPNYMSLRARNEVTWKSHHHVIASQARQSHKVGEWIQSVIASKARQSHKNYLEVFIFHKKE